MNRHIDYIHYNPVKHGPATNPFKWRYFSLAQYQAEGYYSSDWGVNEAISFDGRYGE